MTKPAAEPKEETSNFTLRLPLPIRQRIDDAMAVTLRTLNNECVKLITEALDQRAKNDLQAIQATEERAAHQTKP